METKQNNDNSPAKEVKQNDNSSMVGRKETVNTPRTETNEQNQDASMTETKLQLNEESSVMETKHNGNSAPTSDQANKRTTKKLCHGKAKKTAKKRRNSVKKTPGMTGIFSRLVGSHGHKKHQGIDKDHG